MAGLSATGYGVWYYQQSNQKKEHPSTLARSKGGNKATGQAIPLDSVPSATSKNGLSVDTNSSAAALGQVGGAQDQANGSSSNNSSSSSKTLDPANFKEYDKYKDSENALFGEVQVGSGAEATANSKVAVYYKGWLTNGQLFDQSPTDKDGRLQALAFTLGAREVIPGWEQGIAGMKVGGTRLLIVPPAVGYGAQGHGPVPANAVMVFLVQLVAIE